MEPVLFVLFILAMLGLYLVTFQLQKAKERVNELEHALLELHILKGKLHCSDDITVRMGEIIEETLE